MKILYFATHPLWPANTGARLRDFQLARQLGARAELTFIEMRPAGEKCSAPLKDTNFAGLVTMEKEDAFTAGKLLRGMMGPVPVTILNCWSHSAASRLREVLALEDFDTVQIEGVHLMQYLPVIEEAPGSPAIVVDWHNIESEILWRYAATTRRWARKIAARRTAIQTERAEDILLNSRATHTVTSERERQKLLARHPDANIAVIPNGVDTGYFSAANILEARRKSTPGESRPTLLFSGSMEYHANIDAVTWFARAVWPKIAQNDPVLQFMIVGRDPAPEVRALASDRIHVTGTVDDVRPYYASAVAAVVPIRSGGGTRLKILEAMAAGVPVISTKLGAEGIDAEDGVHLLLADSAEEIAAALSRLACSEELRFRILRAALELARRTYDWSVIGKKLCAIHEDLAAARRPVLAGRGVA